MVYIMSALVTFPAITRKDDTKRPDFSMRKIVELTIESSWKSVIDKAEIVLSRGVKFFDDKRGVQLLTNSVFRVGDPVIIELGYNHTENNPTLIEEFRGYITEVSATTNIVLRCEDEMHNVRKIPVNYSANNTTLKKLLTDICIGYSVDTLDTVQMGDVKFSKTNVGAVLAKLKSDFNLYSFMRGNTLVCGKYYTYYEGLAPTKFGLERNVVDNDLNYKNKEDVVLEVKATSIIKNGNKVEFETGDEGGDVLDLTYYNIEVKAELEKKVKADYEHAKQGGFNGGFTAFGKPSVKHGMKAELSSRVYPERNGIYYIDAVTKTFKKAAYRQQITLSNKTN